MNLKRLKPGQFVYIRKPWFDGIHPGGELHRAKIIRHNTNGVLVDGFGVFSYETGMANFNAAIEPSSNEIVREYEAQHRVQRDGWASPVLPALSQPKVSGFERALSTPATRR